MLKEKMVTTKNKGKIDWICLKEDIIKKAHNTIVFVKPKGYTQI